MSELIKYLQMSKNKPSLLVEYTLSLREGY